MRMDVLGTFARVKPADTAGTNFPGTTAFVLGDVIDMKKTGLDQSVGNDDSTWIIIRTEGVAFTGTETNISIDVVSSDTAPTTTWTSPTTHITGNVFAANANVPAIGQDWMAIQLPRGVYKRYLGLRANYATATPTTGRVQAFLSNDLRNGIIVPQGIVGP